MKKAKNVLSGAARLYILAAFLAMRACMG